MSESLYMLDRGFEPMTSQRHLSPPTVVANVPFNHGPLNRYAKLRVAHVPGIPGTFSPPPLVSDPDMHQGTCVTHVPWCMPGSLTSGFLWCRWRGKHSRHSQRMRNPQFCVSGKRPMAYPSWKGLAPVKLFCTITATASRWHRDGSPQLRPDIG